MGVVSNANSEYNSAFARSGAIEPDIRSKHELIKLISKEIEENFRKLSAILEAPVQTFCQSETQIDFFGWLASEYKNRKRRADFFRPDIFFGEPAWDMLLDLALHKVLGKNISVTSACIGSSAPMTTALRWVSVLENEGLALRKQDETDRRRQFLEISDHGFRMLLAYFNKIKGSSEVAINPNCVSLRHG